MGVQLDKYGKRALELVMEGRSLFITGKAGTGKTTVLREIAVQCKLGKKNVVVTAPTGVAAKIAHGMTIHSFLHLPTGPFVPGMRKKFLYALDQEERRLVAKLDIIIIDEVSMVRCDLLDEIDDVLRHYRKNQLPFGGVQMVMFGDLFQLMPVAPKEEWSRISHIYESPYFFNSKVIERMNLPLFELKTIHRQDNRGFVKLLDSVREGHLSDDGLSKLNSRYMKGFTSKGYDGFIRLVTYNRKANSENIKRLKRLPGKTYEYKAFIEDDYPSNEYPTDYVIRLKRGARVMFVRNDHEERRYVNSTLAIVTSLDDDHIVVRTDEGDVVDVKKQCWTYCHYHINEETKEIETIPCGTFVQYPLKLAWAVTIHKSQGMTFDKVIVDVDDAFTYGQVYVALSRCTSLEGIVLASPITNECIMTDPLVSEYIKEVQRNDFGVKEKATRLPSSIRRARKTLQLLQDGLSLAQIATRRGLTISTIRDHVALLIEYGYANVSDFVSPESYNSVIDAVASVGINSPLKEIKEKCDDRVTYADIKMVMADVRWRGNESDYIKVDDNVQEEANDFEWYFVDDIPFSKVSKYFLTYDCRVVLSPSGYYLEVTGDYIKLGDYQDGFTYDEGNVWIKKPLDDKGYRMVHNRDDDMHLIGYLREELDQIIFTNPDNDVFKIAFNEG
ncbi:MAG: helix-turn-helix domain-containing protein [Prevotella sp.]|nr:helix-turn-helix domain-containing protein [Prevotella sp.]